MRQVILLITNRSDISVLDKIHSLMSLSNESNDFFVLYNGTADSLPKTYANIKERFFCFSNDILYTMGYFPLGDSLALGNCHFPVLKFYLTHPDYDYYWILEDDVTFSGKWDTLFSYYKNDVTDLLSSHIRTYSDYPEWPWWVTLESKEEDFEEKDVICAFNPIYRLSNRALKCIHESLSNGWRGHAEVVLSTILRHNGLTLKDIGGNGRFVPKGEENLFYTQDSHHYEALKIQEIRPNTIYHPIKQKVASSKIRRNCVISAVGANSLHKHWLDGGEDRSFDLHLIVYDKSFSKYYNDADFMSFKKGFKLKLVYDYLKDNPQFLDYYSYFFIPDDDIMADALSIECLFETMDRYSLQIAQPALRQSYFTYMITLMDHLSELRYTNFVEMMLPCFSNHALRKVIDTFNENESGWGVEFRWPLLIETNSKDMAVLDCVPMRHTRPVVQGRTEHTRELNDYLMKYNLSMNVQEKGYVPKKSQSWADGKLEAKRNDRKMLLRKAMMLAEEIIWKKNMGEISKRGLDGLISVALYLKLLADVSEVAAYNDLAQSIVQTLKEEESVICAVESFVSGSLGYKWALNVLNAEAKDSNVADVKRECDETETVRLAQVVGSDMKDLHTMSVCKVMLDVSGLQLQTRRSDVNELIYEMWKTMDELCETEKEWEK